MFIGVRIFVRCLGLLFLSLGLTGELRASLALQTSWYGFTNTYTNSGTNSGSNNIANLNTTITTSKAAYASYNGQANLIKNGGFEYTGSSSSQTLIGGNIFPTDAQPQVNAKFINTVRTPSGSLDLIVPSWTYGGNPKAGSGNDYNGGPYAIWGNDGTGTATTRSIENMNVAAATYGATVIPQGQNAVYTGNAFTSNTGTSVPVYTIGSTSTSMAIAADGKSNVTFTSGSTVTISPTSFGTNVNAIVTMTQTVATEIGATYAFSFWASGEGNVTDTGVMNANGVFFLRVSGETPTITVSSTIYTTETQSSTVTNSWTAALQAPNPGGTQNGPLTTSSTTLGDAGLGRSTYYQYLLTATSTSTTITFGNYGHVTTSTGSKATELILDDVVLVKLVPEASNVAIAVAAGLFLVLQYYCRRKKCLLP